MIHTVIIFSLIALIASPVSVTPWPGAFVTEASADETQGEKIKSRAGDKQTRSKKQWRKTKRKARKITGTSSTQKDIKDAANDVSDDVKNAAKKTKRKID